MITALLTTIAAVLPLAAGHSSIFHPSMYGFNVTDKTFPYDNRPVAPLFDMTFSQWWFHGHLDHPPNPGDIFNLPAGKTATTEIACNKGATSYFNSSEGGDIRNPANPNDVCPGSGMDVYHTTGFDDLTGCALAIAYKNDARDVKPEDFTVFSVNQTCVWTRFTDFQVPARMPPCPEGGCICAWFWIHSPDSGGEQNYMNGFKCNITSPTSNVALAKPKVPRRCGADPNNQKMQSAPANCTYGAKQPFYWFNKEQNNMFEGAFSPPIYKDLYNFVAGAQNDIFVDSYSSLPDPAPNAAMPVLAGVPNASSTSSGLVPPATSAPVGSPTAVQRVGTNSTTLLTGQTANPNHCKIKPSTPGIAARSLGHGSSGRSILSMAKRSRRLQAGKRSSLWHIF